MNDETKRWESYVDDAGRRHWRWPAAPRIGVQAGDGDRKPSRATWEQPQAMLLPLRVRSR
jgi:hypothetical protein